MPLPVTLTPLRPAHAEAWELPEAGPRGAEPHLEAPRPRGRRCRASHPGSLRLQSAASAGSRFTTAPSSFTVKLTAEPKQEKEPHDPSCSFPKYSLFSLHKNLLELPLISLAPDQRFLVAAASHSGRPIHAETPLPGHARFIPSSKHKCQVMGLRKLLLIRIMPRLAGVLIHILPMLSAEGSAGC